MIQLKESESEDERRAAIVADHNRIADAIKSAQAKAARIGADGWRETPGDPLTIWFSRIDLARAALEDGNWVRAEELLELHTARFFTQSRRQAGTDTTRAKGEHGRAAIKEAVDMLVYRDARKREVARLAAAFGCSLRTVDRALSE